MGPPSAGRKRWYAVAVAFDVCEGESEKKKPELSSLGASLSVATTPCRS